MSEEPFTRLPLSVRRGIVFLTAGWAWATIAQIWYLTKIPLFQILFGIFICTVVIKIVDWGRLLSIFANLVILIGNFAIGIKSAFTGRAALSAISLVTAFIFSISTYYLLKKETSEFYRRQGGRPKVIS